VKKSRVRGAFVLAGVLVVLPAVACFATGYLVRHQRAERFRQACADIRGGEYAAEADARFVADDLGVRSHGLTSSGTCEHAWQRNAGYAPVQHCRAEIDCGSRQIVHADYSESNSFDRCADPGIYPRRYVLCRAARAVFP
jgi:hypothetical protein